MTHVRIIAAAATAVALAFAFAPAASARSCEDGEAACTRSAQQAAPMKLDQFMNTWKPVSKRAKKHKASRKPAVEQTADSKPAAVETQPPADLASTVATNAEQTIETSGVAVTDFNEANELDAAADRIQVVAFNEINEIDLAAPPPPPPVETTGQSVSVPEPAPADNSWIGKLLLAAAGTIALAGATRFLIA